MNHFFKFSIYLVVRLQHL